MKVVLHIGADKCGSTAIQRTLYNNADLLQERRIAYLAGEFILAHDGTLCRMENGERLIDCEKLRQRLEMAEQRNSSMMILSFEGFHTVAKASLEEAREVLKDHEIQIVYYIREQADYVNSALLQRAKTKFEAERVLRVYRGKWQGFLGHNYAGILCLWRSVFPEETIHVRVFERSSLVGGDVVEDFFECIGISLEGLNRDAGAVNTSITLETAVTLGIMNALGMTASDKGSVAIGSGDRVGGCRQVLPAWHIWMIRLRNLRCNVSLARRYFGRLKLFRYKSMPRGCYSESRVLEVLKETGAQFPHVFVGEESAVAANRIGFLQQGFSGDDKGVVIPEGNSRLRIRCGDWHAAELRERLKVSLLFSRPAADVSVELWGQKTEVVDGSAEFIFDMNNISILETTEIIFDCGGSPVTLESLSAEYPR